MEGNVGNKAVQFGIKIGGYIEDIEKMWERHGVTTTAYLQHSRLQSGKLQMTVILLELLSLIHI